MSSISNVSLDPQVCIWVVKIENEGLIKLRGTFDQIYRWCCICHLGKNITIEECADPVITVREEDLARQLKARKENELITQKGINAGILSRIETKPAIINYYTSTNHYTFESRLP